MELKPNILWAIEELLEDGLGDELGHSRVIILHWFYYNRHKSLRAEKLLADSLHLLHREGRYDPMPIG